jgi:hypothetical protein
MIYADFMTEIRVILSLLGGCFGLVIGAIVMSAIVAGQRPKKKPPKVKATPQTPVGVKLLGAAAKFAFKRYRSGRNR